MNTNIRFHFSTQKAVILYLHLKQLPFIIRLKQNLWRSAFRSQMSRSLISRPPRFASKGTEVCFIGYCGLLPGATQFVYKATAVYFLGHRGLLPRSLPLLPAALQFVSWGAEDASSSIAVCFHWCQGLLPRSLRFASSGTAVCFHCHRGYFQRHLNLLPSEPQFAFASSGTAVCVQGYCCFLPRAPRFASKATATASSGTAVCFLGFRECFH